MSMDIEVEKVFKSNFPSNNWRSGIIREIEEEIEKIEKISEIEKKRSWVISSENKHKTNLTCLREDFNLYLAGHYSRDPLNEYEKLVKKLEKLRNEIGEEFRKINNQKQGEQKNKDYKLKKTPYRCAECFKENTGEYIYHNNKKDGQKFCSNNCFYRHYSKTCEDCLEKCVVNYQGQATGFSRIYYRDGINKTGTLCSKCRGEKLKEEGEEEKKVEEWEKELQDLYKEQNNLIKRMINIDNKENKDREREREREREQNQSLLQYFTTNSIDSIRLDNNKLFIKYNHKAEEEEEEEEEPNSSELQQIKDYLATIPTKSINKSELESKSKQDSSLGNENKGSNLGLVIGLGIGGIFILLLVLILMRKKYRK